MTEACFGDVAANSVQAASKQAMRLYVVQLPRNDETPEAMNTKEGFTKATVRSLASGQRRASLRN